MLSGGELAKEANPWSRGYQGGKRVVPSVGAL